MRFASCFGDGSAGAESGFERTVSGLLRKRAGLFNEAERLRDRITEIKNDLEAIDRTLGVLGYKGELDTAMPRQRRQVLRHSRNALTLAIETDADCEEPAGQPSDTRKEMVVGGKALLKEHSRDQTAAEPNVAE